MSKPTDIQSIGSLISEVGILGKELLASEQDEVRLKLINAAEKLIIASRTPGENSYLTSTQGYVNGAIGAAYAIGIFESIPENQNGTTADEISEKTGAEKLLIVRILRLLTASHIFVETGFQQYAHSHLSRVLSDPTRRAYFHVANNVMGPGITSLDKYLESHGLKNPTDINDAPFQTGLRTDLNLWTFLKAHPEASKKFNDGMRSNANIGNAAPYFGWDTELKCESDEVLIVDVGGGKGQALEAILNAYPLKGRMILQDLPDVIADTNASGHLPRSIETMVNNFFEPQPIKNAKAYFLRRILHDWGDEATKTILRNIIPAMSSESRILISDMILPDEGCEKKMAVGDMIMMSMGGMERSEKQWEELLGEIGLRIKKIWRKEGENLAIIETLKVKD